MYPVPLMHLMVVAIVATIAGLYFYKLSPLFRERRRRNKLRREWKGKTL